MSTYEEFSREKALIDQYLNKGFQIVSAAEGLSGMLLGLEHPGGEAASIPLLTADARKYVISVWLGLKREERQRIAP